MKITIYDDRETISSRGHLLAALLLQPVRVLKRKKPN
jgi:hypothetical protein